MDTHSYRALLEDVIAGAGVTIDGGRPWDIVVRDPRFFQRVLAEGELGLGESYMDGWWDAEQLDELVARILWAGLDQKVPHAWSTRTRIALAKLTNLQSRRRAFMVGERHYDLGNDLFSAMLDGRMNYSCAYWEGAASLDEAQENKLDLLCCKLGLEPGMRVLDIGCGWGAFGKYAAEHYGVEVVGITVSKEQVALGQRLCEGLPVEFRLMDYRDLKGFFDRVVSVGMIEHVGPRNYRPYFEAAHRCLAPGGLFLLHTIGANQSTTSPNPWMHRYIFPNGKLPSIAQISHAVEGLFVMEDWHGFGPDYDRTLLAWHQNVTEAWPALAGRYDERFRRMWSYYLLSCAGAFRARHIQLWQVVLSKGGVPGGYRRVTSRATSAWSCR